MRSTAVGHVGALGLVRMALDRVWPLLFVNERVLREKNALPETAQKADWF